MFVNVQNQYKNQFLEWIKNFDQDDQFFQIVDKPVDSHIAESQLTGHLIIGDLSYLDFFSNIKASKILVGTKKTIDDKKLFQISQQSLFFVVEENNSTQLGQLLKSIKAEALKSLQVEFVKSEIQKKRKELEFLNNRLSSESEKKIESLEKSHIEETEKNQKEKNLLHFLDFIQSESAGDDFIEKTFKFIWKDLKKCGRLNLAGLSMLASSGKSKILFYDGVSESTSVAGIDFSAENISSQLASAWGRPVGKIMSWQLPESSRESYFFVEVVDGQENQDKISLYMTERIAVLSMYLDRWMIEKEIEVAVDRWKNTFRSFSGSTHVVDENFKIYQSNYPHNSGEYCYKVLAKRDSPCVACPIKQNRNTNFVLKEGVSVKTYVSQFKFQSKKYYFVIYEDVTKLNQLYSHIIQTEKMSTIGRLGNHLAHELNNPLTGIKSYVQTLMEDQQSMLSLPSTDKSDLNEILKATIRCQKIIKNFIDFSQKKEPSLEVVQFSEVLQNTLVLLKTALRSHRLFIDLKDDKIKANAYDLQQVLFNLIKNSCQAMQENSSGPGAIKIYQEHKELKDGSQILFHIEDTGPGFDEAILKHLFEPFMTTKEQGEGTGLGLYLSKKLMNNMGADLQVTSSSKKGAKITLVFARL